MNYIFLEGMSLYLFLIIVALLFLVSAVCIVWVVMSERRVTSTKNLLSREKAKIRKLVKENFKLRLRYGEFDIDDM